MIVYQPLLDAKNVDANKSHFLYTRTRHRMARLRGVLVSL